MIEKSKWLDISEETEREYLYPGENPGDDLRILRVEEPLELRVEPSSLGGHAHRIKTKDGFGYYIAPGWLALRWKVAAGQPIFKF